jgi:hypothetical protein
METILQALGALLAAVIVALTPRLVALAGAILDFVQQRALLAVQQRLGEGAARIAAEIAAEVHASPDVQAATRAMLEKGVFQLQDRFGETIKTRGIPFGTLSGMLAGELGKLGVAVQK